MNTMQAHPVQPKRPVTVVLSHIIAALEDMEADRPNMDPWIRQGTAQLLANLEPIHDQLIKDTTYSRDRDRTHMIRRSALEVLFALERGLDATDARTYAVDRAHVTPLVEDVLRAIVVASVTV